MKLEDYTKLSELLTKLRYEVIKSIDVNDSEEIKNKTDEILDAICIVQNVMIMEEQ